MQTSQHWDRHWVVLPQVAMITHANQWLVDTFNDLFLTLSQETLSQVKRNPSPDCYLTHGGVHPLGLRWDILQTLPLTLVLLLPVHTAVITADAEKWHLFCFTYTGVASRFSLCTWLRWLSTQASVFFPHQRVYTWGFRDIYSLDNLRSPRLTWNWINNNL